MVGRSAQDGREHQHPPAVARYAAANGATFVLDLSNRGALLKFERSNEIWALTPSPGPRGDIIYKNDLGQPVLRRTRVGGLTLFTPDNEMGAPVSMLGQAQALRPLQLTPQALLTHLARASGRASRASKRLIPFEAPNVNSTSALITADAAAVAADAIERLAASANGRAAAAQIRKVRIVPGRRADVSVQSGVLEVVVVPGGDLTGRPSSARITRVVAQR